MSLKDRADMEKLAAVAFRMMATNLENIANYLGIEWTCPGHFVEFYHP